MFWIRRVATFAAALAATWGTFVATSHASLVAKLPLEKWAVYGSLTPKKLNEPVVLPKGSTFDGLAVLEIK